MLAEHMKSIVLRVLVASRSAVSLFNIHQIALISLECVNSAVERNSRGFFVRTTTSVALANSIPCVQSPNRVVSAALYKAERCQAISYHRSSIT